MTEIESWVATGAGVREGLRLLSLYKPNPYLARLVEAHPDKYAGLLRRTLTGVSREAAAEKAIRRKTFREEWPFLGKPDCPNELKILAADKITAWTEFARYHERLFGCTDRKACAETAKKCIFFFAENRKIHSEFQHFRDTGKVLGRHPVFAAERQRRELLDAGPIEWGKMRTRLLDNIGRLRRQLRDPSRPELAAERAELLRGKEDLLARVERLIEDYQKSYERKRQ